jgi:hypothetical protein
VTPAPVTDCPTCDGLSWTVRDCDCVPAGDRFLVDTTPADRAPWRDCRLCHGTGRRTRVCAACDGRGCRRAQLVLTVANLDTGQVASADLRPGALPAPQPSPGGGWHVTLTPVVRDLAATVDAHAPVDTLGRPLGEEFLLLPRDWSPDLPPERRKRLEAAALAGWSRQPWRVWLGRTTAPAAPPPHPAAQLLQLCALAGPLCLDLVVEARRDGTGLVWHVRYDVPGATVPARPAGWATDLADALRTTTVDTALWGLATRGLTAPAHELRPTPPADPAVDAWLDAEYGLLTSHDRDRLHRAGVDVDRLADPDGHPPTLRPAGLDADLGWWALDRLARRITADTRDRPGAQAVWRDGRWWHTRLRPVGAVETLTALDTGQVRADVQPVLVRDPEPPAPTWLGPPIRYAPCPACHPPGAPEPVVPANGCAGAGLPPADAATGPTGGDPATHRTGGATGPPGRGGAVPEVTCLVCGGLRVVPSACVVTLTDLTGRVAHHTWSAESPVDAPVIGRQPGGAPVHRLPDAYRVGELARRFGVDPEHLAEVDHGSGVDQDLRDGTPTVTGPPSGALPAHLARAARGRPAGRLLLAVRPPDDTPDLAGLVRLGLGLGLPVTVAVCDHRDGDGDPTRVHGVLWRVTLGSSDPLPVDLLPDRADPASAVVDALERLDGVLAAVAAGPPDQPVPAPRAAEAYDVDDPVPGLLDLAAARPDQVVTARWDHEGRTPTSTGCPTVPGLRRSTW